MRFPRGFVIGLAAAFAAGILAAAAQASVTTQYEDSPLTVPVSRVGDEVTYAQFEKGRPQPVVQPGQPSIYSRLPTPAIKHSAARPTTPTPTQDATAWSEPVYAGTKVGGTTKTTDRTGQVHDSLLLTSRTTIGSQATLAEHVDRETRLTIRSDWTFTTSNPSLETRSVYSSFNILKPQLPGIEWQGRTLRLGMDVTDAYTLPNWVDPQLDEVQLESRVDQRAYVGDYDTYVIRTELQFRENARSPAASALDSQLFGVDYRLILIEYTYVTASVPYPVLVHRYVNWIHDSDVTSYEELDSLVKYQAGSQPVAWTQPAKKPSYRSANEDVERTPGSQTHPAGGRGDRLRYSLDEAIQTVQEDPALVRFWRWSLDNTGYRLVGANLQAGRLADDPDSLRWVLVFATPQGKGFIVETERASASPSRINREVGEAALPEFLITDLPAHPVTLAGADHLWSSMVTPEMAQNAPNRVVWGWGESPGKASKISKLQELRIGYDAREQRDQELTMLTLDTATGNVLRFHEHRADFECDDCVITVSAAPPAIVPNMVAAGVQPPSVTHAAVATTSFMALFIALYFLPIAHFLSTQAFVLFPGFAKLRKDEILDNRLRDQILTLIKNEPGIHASDIARRVEAGWGTIVYHLSVLERSKMISSLVDGRHKRFFPVGIVDFGRRGQLAVLRNTTTKTIFQMIAADPGVIQGEIANRSSLSVPAAIWHLRRLEEAGLVGRAKDGRRVHYFANKEEDIPVPYDERDAVEIV